MVLSFNFVFPATCYTGHLRIIKAYMPAYNPDCHWSSALYSGLSVVQLENGADIVNLGRDDQAGFRLDTMATHRLQDLGSEKE